MSLSLDACVAQHIGDRKEQQDRVVLCQHPRNKRVIMAVVADGMGGHAGGALAAEQVALTARNMLDRFSPREDVPEDELIACLNESHLLIRSGRFVNEQDPHSTGVILLVYPAPVPPRPKDADTPEPPPHWRAAWAHCGDSRMFRFRDGQLVFRTRDHSYVEELVRTGKIRPEDAEHHPNKNILVTALGGAEPPRIDTGGADDLQGGDAFLLCSDGLWAYFSEAELGHALATRSARGAAEHLVARARERARGKGDNLSVVVIRIIDKPDPVEADEASASVRLPAGGR